MPSYTYDPAAGQAVETSSIDQSLSAADSAEVDISQSLQQTEDQSLKNAVENLTRRNDTTTDVGGSDDSAGEVELLNLQKQLSEAQNNGDFLQVESLSAKCEALATALVTGQQAAPDPIKEQKWKQAKQDAEDEIKFDAGIQDALDHAGANFSDDQIAEWNKALTKGSASDKQIVAETLVSYKNNPEYYTSEHTPLDDDAAMAIVHSIGKERAADVITLSRAVSAGHATPTDALKLASKDPGLMKSLKELCAQGLIKIKL